MSRLQSWANICCYLNPFSLLRMYLTSVFGFPGLRRAASFFLGNHIYRILCCPYSRQIEREWTIFPGHTEQRAVKQCQPTVSKYRRWRQVALKCIWFSPVVSQIIINNAKGRLMYFLGMQEISNTIKHIKYILQKFGFSQNLFRWIFLIS